MNNLFLILLIKILLWIARLFSHADADRNNVPIISNNVNILQYVNLINSSQKLKNPVTICHHYISLFGMELKVYTINKIYE